MQEECGVGGRGICQSGAANPDRTPRRHVMLFIIGIVPTCYKGMLFIIGIVATCYKVMSFIIGIVATFYKMMLFIIGIVATCYKVMLFIISIVATCYKVMLLIIGIVATWQHVKTKYTWGSFMWHHKTHIFTLTKLAISTTISVFNTSDYLIKVADFLLPQHPEYTYFCHKKISLYLDRSYPDHKPWCKKRHWDV